MAMALGVVLAVTMGCAVAGNPVPAPDPAALDVGPYSRSPLLAPAHGSEYRGRVIESVRMAEIMLNPVDVDQALQIPLSRSRAVPLPTPAKAAALLADPVRAVLERHGMLAGFTVGATDTPSQVVVGGGRLLQVMVLRFPDPAAAQRAAQEIDAVDAAVSSDNVSVAIPEHPAAHAHWRPTVPTIAATVAQDAFVVSVLAGHTSPDLSALITLARRTFDVQVPLLRDFAPTPPDRFAELPLDRDGMLGRMVPEAPGRWPFPVVILGDLAANAGWGSLVQARGIVYGPRGAERFAGSSQEPVELLGLNRFDRLMRFADAATAQKYFTRRKTPEGGVEVAAPAGLVDVRCTDTLNSTGMVKFDCVLRHGRYVALVFSRDYRDVQQRAAAQYALLVNSE
ncbi:hypothetical protein OG563_45850 [Nocardia vinacea]|uniref:Uncharacterized protein n=1 Tax=Nocardia vinacea TaxID=96468 RepID=A0ABZ1YT70_9NOCA|nr:hypothetical protein [Nocardia vinacea]